MHQLLMTLVCVGRLVLGEYSKRWFGLGLEEWQDGAQADKIIQAVQTAFAVLGDKSRSHEPQERAKVFLVEYFTAVLAAVSATATHGALKLLVYSIDITTLF